MELDRSEFEKQTKSSLMALFTLLVPEVSNAGDKMKNSVQQKILSQQSVRNASLKTYKKLRSNSFLGIFGLSQTQCKKHSSSFQCWNASAS